MITDFTATSDDQGRAAIVQTDDKIVVAGESNNTGDRDFALARYTVDITTEGTTTTVTSVPNPSAVSQAVIASFRVTALAGSQPTGTVMVSDGTVNCTGTLVVDALFRGDDVRWGNARSPQQVQASKP